MTSLRFKELKANPGKVSTPREWDEYLRLLIWEKQSNAAKRAVETKRKRYASWPCNRKRKAPKLELTPEDLAKPLHQLRKQYGA